LDLSHGESKSNWNIIECKDIKPGRRYGHTMVNFKSNIILFGGVLKEKNKLTNEIWILNLENYLKRNENKISHSSTLSVKIYFTWKLIKFDSNKLSPQPRMYHSCGICKTGKARGMITIFGGRDANGEALNDVWGLRKHKNGNWEWVLPMCDKSTVPLGRYQHTVIFYSNFMILFGGRGDENKDFNSLGMPIEMFNTQSLNWTTNLYLFDKYRHTSFLLDNFVYLHGGCNLSTPSDPNEIIDVYNVQELCYNYNTR